MGDERSDSTLPWSWVIEALAKSALVNTSLLDEVVCKAPPLLGRSGKAAKEALALRGLEKLVHPPNGLNKNVAVSDLSEIGFDPAESCEAALQRLTSSSKGASDELNRDIELFIKHKKASLPKSTLELLKDAILEGTPPHFAPLKEISGLDVQNQCMLIVPFHGGDLTCPPLKSDEEDHADRTMFSEEIGCSPRSGVEYQQLQAFSPEGNLLSCTGGVRTLCPDNHVLEIDAASHGMDNQIPPAKKLKTDRQFGKQSIQQHPIPVGSSKMFSTGAGRYHEVIKANGKRDGIPNGKNDDWQAKTSVNNHDQQQILPNNDDNCCEEVNLAFKSANFMSSQCMLIRDSLAMTESESEPNICMKCSKSGHLLSCSARSCTLLFHESCLGSSVTFDDEGNFYCPFCAYSLSISDYVIAEEKVFQARKNLSLFIGGRTVDQTLRDDSTSSGNNVNEDSHTNANQTAEVKKGATIVTIDAEPHQSSLKGNSLELSRSSSYIDANELVLVAEQLLSIKDRQGAEIVIHPPRGPAGIWNHTQDYGGCDGPQIGDNEQIKNGNVKFAELKRKHKTSKLKITEFHGDAYSESIRYSQGLQDKRNDGTISLPCPEALSSILDAPQFRRKKVSWTEEEEAMLKKGVKALVPGEGRAISWKAILEYGSSVFHKGRTPIDLKDKWRNIMARETSHKVK